MQARMTINTALREYEFDAEGKNLDTIMAQAIKRYPEWTSIMIVVVKEVER